MHTNHCCEGAAAEISVARTSARSSFARRCYTIAEWTIPAAGLMLVPKCPACLAAYIVLVSGVGISVTSAMYLKILLLTICAASIIYVAARRSRNLLALIRANRSSVAPTVL
jgi:hypothetical protein